MAKMTAAMFYGKGDIRVEDIPRPVAGPGEVLMRVRYCGICGSDARSYQRGSPPGGFPLPRIMGHEFSGHVVEMGAGVSGFQIGDRVAAAPATYCGECFYCRRGARTLCLHALDFGTSNNGALAEYVLVPSRLVSLGGLVKLSAEVSDETAALIEPLGACYHGVITRGHLRSGETVVVIGDGAIGLIQVMLARHAGAGTVICAGHHHDRLERARDIGAQVVVNTHNADLKASVAAVTAGEGADLVMVSVPSPEALPEALPLARGDGRIVLFGGVPKGSSSTLDPNDIHYRELTVTGAFNCSVEEYRRAAEIAPGLPLEAVVTHHVPLSRVLQGFEIMAAKQGLRVLVGMSE